MNQLEMNITRSFQLVKSDIIKLQQDIAVLSQTQERIMDMIKALEDRMVALEKKRKRKK
jgi:hypothetical protein